ncbi:MAG: hypothetical protein ACTTK0_02495 [Stomatobaculum sp.]
METDITIDTAKLTYDDIKPSVRWYISHEVNKEQNPNGSWRRIYKGEDHFKTKVGLIPLSRWTEIAKEVVEAAGDGALLSAIIEHVSGYGWNFKAWGGVETYALECLIGGAYKAWEERGEFTPPELSFSQLLRINSEEG